MQKLIIILFSILFYNCSGQERPLAAKSTQWIDPITLFIKEIPAYKDSTVVYSYKFKQQEEKQLGLGQLESGFDSLQIRIWYGNALLDPKYLIVIMRTEGKWTAYQYKIFYEKDSVTPKLLSPKFGWDSFISRLLELKITILPNMTDIAGLIDDWEDGSYCDFEIATKKIYRFYCYHQPHEFSNQFWQAKNVTDILLLISQELE